MRERRGKKEEIAKIEKNSENRSGTRWFRRQYLLLFSSLAGGDKGATYSSADTLESEQPNQKIFGL